MEAAKKVRRNLQLLRKELFGGNPNTKTPEPLMDVDPRVRSRLKRQMEDYQYVFESHVPISQINLPPIWNEYRYKANKEKLEKTGSMPPVFLSFNEETQKYDIEDGIHRIHSAKDLSYEGVPAVVSYSR